MEPNVSKRTTASAFTSARIWSMLIYDLRDATNAPIIEVRLTSMASLRMSKVGTRFGTLESIFRKSRGYNFLC